MGGIISSGKKYSSEGEEKKDQEELVNGIHTRIGYSSLFSTVSSHLLDPQELFEKQKSQEKLADFVIQHFFYGVPVSSKQKSTVTGLGPIWIEPLPHIVEQSLAGQFEEGHVRQCIIFFYCLLLFWIGPSRHSSDWRFSEWRLFNKDLFYSLFG